MEPRDMDFARQSAGMPHNRTTREAEKEWPRMHAALLSANKEFGVPMPPIVNEAVMDLECGRRFLEQILPLLRADHAAEAGAMVNEKVPEPATAATAAEEDDRTTAGLVKSMLRMRFTSGK